MTSIVSSLHSQSEPITDVIRFIMSDTPRNILKMACLNKKYQKIAEEVLTQYIDAYIASRGQHSLVGRIKHHLSSCCSPLSTVKGCEVERSCNLSLPLPKSLPYWR